MGEARPLRRGGQGGRAPRRRGPVRPPRRSLYRGRRAQGGWRLGPRPFVRSPAPGGARPGPAALAGAQQFENTQTMRAGRPRGRSEQWRPLAARGGTARCGPTACGRGGPATGERSGGGCAMGRWECGAPPARPVPSPRRAAAAVPRPGRRVPRAQLCRRAVINGAIKQRGRSSVP